MEGWPEEISPFHRGERALQARLGIEDRQEVMGRRMMRRFMPGQHREFFEQLPFVILGSVDEDGAPWASIVADRPGFVETLTDKTMRINAHPLSGDPLREALVAKAPVSLLGIEPHTRRRNRANLRVMGQDDGGFDLRLTMSFGNCPKYIQTRLADWNATPSGEIRKDVLDVLTDEAQTLIAQADTFFVASHNDQDDPENVGGVDVNHRGGAPGFVRVDGQTLTIPDFGGNRIFNTLGNLYLNPRAGLLFIDFDTGDVLQLTGSTNLLLDADETETGFVGAERAWQFTFERGHYLRAAVPSSWKFGDYAPQLGTLGAWPER